MADFTIRIAGHAAAVSTLFASTRDYCRAYLTEETAEFSIEVTREDLLREQEELLAEARREGIRPRVFPDPFLERSVIQRKLAEQLLERDVLLLHGSTVAVDGEAYLFTAQCGTGKSTHTRLYRQVFGPRAVMVNDDKPFLRITKNGVAACGSPWSGKHGLDTNIMVPLKGICILQRGEENRIWRIPAEAALPMLLHQSGEPMDSSRMPKLRSLVEALSVRIPLWQMQCTKDARAAEVSYAAMSAL